MGFFRVFGFWTIYFLFGVVFGLFGLFGFVFFLLGQFDLVLNAEGI